jgi:hypothetical protein
MNKFTDLFQRQKNADGKYKKPYYSIRGVHADKVIDVAQDGPNAGSLILWEGYAGENQQFTLVQEGPDWYIKCKKNGQYLTVENGTNGCKITTAPKSNTPNQKFRIDDAKPGSKDHVIYTFCGKALDILEDKKDNGARISQYDYSGKKNQLWNFCDPKHITSSSSDND